jgi:hypothetical protein
LKREVGLLGVGEIAGLQGRAGFVHQLGDGAVVGVVAVGRDVLVMMAGAGRFGIARMVIEDPAG